MQILERRYKIYFSVLNALSGLAKNIAVRKRRCKKIPLTKCAICPRTGQKRRYKKCPIYTLPL
jgi:hypothetical protein